VVAEIRTHVVQP